MKKNDLSNIDNWRQTFSKKIIAFPLFVKTFFEIFAKETMDMAVERTPVDTGNLKGQWRVSNVYLSDRGFVVDIYNQAKDPDSGVMYGSWVELGHRIVVNGAEVGWQEGRFMLTISVDEMRKRMPQMYREEFRKHFGDR